MDSLVKPYVLLVVSPTLPVAADYLRLLIPFLKMRGAIPVESGGDVPINPIGISTGYLRGIMQGGIDETIMEVLSGCDECLAVSFDSEGSSLLCKIRELIMKQGGSLENSRLHTLCEHDIVLEKCDEMSIRKVWIQNMSDICDGVDGRMSERLLKLGLEPCKINPQTEREISVVTEQALVLQKTGIDTEHLAQTFWQALLPALREQEIQAAVLHTGIMSFVELGKQLCLDDLLVMDITHEYLGEIARWVSERVN